MEIILLQKVANLGKIGDRVTVKSGYGAQLPAAQGQGDAGDRRERREVRGAARRARAQGAPGAGAGAAARRGARGLQAHDQGQGRHRGQAVRLDRHRGHRRGRHQRGPRAARSEVRMPGGPLRTVGEHRAAAPAHRRRCELPVTIVAEEAA